MATFNKFQVFVENLAEGVHDLQNDTLKLLLTNTLPVNTHTTKTNITEITPGNGYTTGGVTLTVSASAQTSGTYKLTIADESITATGGAIATFQYAVLYNDTPSSPADPLIAWWTNSTSISLATGESVNFNFDDAEGVFQLS